MKPALYIHIPFCAQKCAYCDFASWAGREPVWEAYFHTLKEEMRPWMEINGGNFYSVFVGGGTPSLVPAERIAEILRGVSAGEVTLEANPGTLTPKKLEIYRQAGVNRLSMGVQSFDDGLLNTLGRIHTARQAEEAFFMAREAGFDNLNLDLMYALPGQTQETWERTLEQAAALGPEHISAYSLILEEGTPMATWATPLPDEDVNRMQRTATAFLKEKGYARYEISNYARPGRECRHNLVYWRRGDYIGVGCAAHSLYQGRRFANPDSLGAYLAGARRTEDTLLTEEDVLEERLMLGLRTAEGVPRGWIRENAQTRRMVREGLAILEKDRFFLTEKGMEVQDAVVLALLQ